MALETVMSHYPVSAQVPVRNNADYGLIVAENLSAVTALAVRQLGDSARLVAYSHCYTLVPSPVIGGSAFLFTMLATFEARITAGRMAELSATPGASVVKP